MNKINYKYNKDDDRYLMLDINNDLLLIAANDTIDIDIRNEAFKMYSKFISLKNKLRDEANYSLVSFSIDSNLGKYILEHEELFRDEHSNVTYDKIVNAFNIALFSNNIKMSNKIYPLFKERISGNKEELLNDNNENILNYILNNDNFSDYLDIVDKKEKNYKYLVYESNEYFIKNNTKNKSLIKK